jgi:hypothetical protein
MVSGGVLISSPEAMLRALNEQWVAWIQKEAVRADEVTVMFMSVGLEEAS